jgi:hypothetical protein
MTLDDMVADLFDLDRQVEPALDAANAADTLLDDSADCTNDTCTNTCLTCE